MCLCIIFQILVVRNSAYSANKISYNIFLNVFFLEQDSSAVFTSHVQNIDQIILRYFIILKVLFFPIFYSSFNLYDVCFSFILVVSFYIWSVEFVPFSEPNDIHCKFDNLSSYFPSSHYLICTCLNLSELIFAE